MKDSTNDIQKIINNNDLAKFAAGAEVSDNIDGHSDSEVVNSSDRLNTIEEKCPSTYFSERNGITYPDSQHITYFSTTCNLERGANILLPADYTSDKQYPVFYMLHGIFGDEYSFTNDNGNRIKEIITNMTADGLIEDTIIVFPNMFASSDPDQKPSFNLPDIIPYDNFVNDLVNDLMPYIEASYSVKAGRDNTVLAGFSMGGREALFISHEHPELFGYVCSIAPAPGLTPGTDFAGLHPGQLSEDELRFTDDAVLHDVYMICCGTNDSIVGKFPLSYHEILERNGVQHTWYEITGADHDNNAIRSGVYNLFKQLAYHKRH